MNLISRLLLAGTVLAAPALANAALLIRDIPASGVYSGAVTSPTAWAEENPVNGDEVNFWRLTGNTGDRLTVTATSPLNLGMSLYFGLVEELDLLIGGFSNSASFGGNVFVAGTPSFGAVGASLTNILLPSTGTYTLAIGGEGFGFDSSFPYTMSVTVAPVPLPAPALLMAPGLLGLLFMRRRTVGGRPRVRRSASTATT